MTSSQHVVRKHVSASDPHVAWVCPVETVADVDLAAARARADRIGEADVVLVGPADVLGGSSTSGNDDALSAIAAATSAEYLVFAHPRATLTAPLVSKAVARLESHPSCGQVRCSYALESDRYIVIEDLDAIDSALGQGNLPLFAVVRRSETGPTESWQALRKRLGVDKFVSASVDVSDVPTTGASFGARGPRQIATQAVRLRRNLAAKIRRAAEDLPQNDETGQRVDVAYIGLAGHDNLGDDAMLAAVEALMPWAQLRVNPADAQAVILGGGTLINADSYYLNRIRRVDAPAIESLVFGTGIRNIGFFDVTEPYERWHGFLARAGKLGVRGPDSAATLRSFGYEGDIEVIGDPALSLHAPAHAGVEGQVVVAPLHAGGALHGGNDGIVLEAMASTVARLRRIGHPVTLMSCHPNDDRWVLEMIRRVQDLDVDYLAGYADLDATLAALAAAEMVLGERLHASVLAAAVGTAWAGIEYRPKVRDFARSVDQEDAVVRTDEIGRLDDVVDAVWEQRQQRVAAVAQRVAEFRTRQAAMAENFRRRVAESITGAV